MFDLLRRMLPNGKKTAKDMYGLNGFVAHHNTDIFGDCAPQDTYMPATIWPMGGAWLSLHIWRHYQYTKDLEFLRANVDILKEASLFFTEYLFKNGQGEWVTGPSVSPENTYIHASGEKGQLCVGPSMDSQIIYDLFTACEESARLTGQEDDFTRSLSSIKNALPKLKIGADGRLQEWAEEYEEADKGHRHISHLYALYPSEQITYERTPELIEAARKTLECRLENGGGHTGWSRAWIINMWARLRDGEKAGENVQQLLMKSTAINLFDMHPPFQIDGNFGAIAGIIEMLVQDTGGDIKFLPALPKSWHSGEVKGIRLRGNITVNISWENGKLTEVELI